LTFQENLTFHDGIAPNIRWASYSSVMLIGISQDYIELRILAGQAEGRAAETHLLSGLHFILSQIIEIDVDEIRGW
jgi:hypothetical protein